MRVRSSANPNFERLVDTRSDYGLLLDRDRGHKVVVDVQQLLRTPALVQVPNAHAFIVAH